MNIVDENGKFQEEREEDENYLWLPFEQYKDQNDIKISNRISTWTSGYVRELISHSFPWHEEDRREDAHYNCSDKPPSCKSMAKKLSYLDDFFTDKQSKGYWDKLLHSSWKKKRVVNKQNSIWNQNYVNGLSLHTLHINRQEALDDSIKESKINYKICIVDHIENGYVQCSTSLISDESESEGSGDEVDESDPMYSRFAVIRKSFHTSEDGVVFYCQKELDRYKAKMAEMEDLLENELKEIKNQHDKLRLPRVYKPASSTPEKIQLKEKKREDGLGHFKHYDEIPPSLRNYKDFNPFKNLTGRKQRVALKIPNSFTMAKRAEERKLLSEGLDSSNDHDLHEEESTEKDALNSANNRQSSTSKQERKSAIFSSIHDVFSYARTGIQGMFVKTSPNTPRKVRTNDSDSEESDDEDTIISSCTSSNKHSAPLLDNHDEFTRQMTSDGGLKYESSDKSVQQLSYKNLPPPLSLHSLQDKTSKS